MSASTAMLAMKMIITAEGIMKPARFIQNGGKLTKIADKKLKISCYECQENGVDCNDHTGRGTDRCRENRRNV
jgi:hypothetical protein